MQKGKVKDNNIGSFGYGNAQYTKYNAPGQNISPSDPGIRDVFLSFLHLMKEKHNMSLQELISLYNGSAAKDLIPAAIFSFPLSPAESICKFLKENQGLNFHEIGGLLNRDERGIWGSYNRAAKKMPSIFSISQCPISIPVSVFKDRSLSILENVAYYLSHELKMKTKDISKLLNKKQPVIYTTLQRALKKKHLGGKQDG